MVKSQFDLRFSASKWHTVPHFFLWYSRYSGKLMLSMYHSLFPKPQFLLSLREERTFINCSRCWSSRPNSLSWLSHSCYIGLWKLTDKSLVQKSLCPRGLLPPVEYSSEKSSQPELPTGPLLLVNHRSASPSAQSCLLHSLMGINSWGHLQWSSSTKISVSEFLVNSNPGYWHSEH